MSDDIQLPELPPHPFSAAERGGICWWEAEKAAIREYARAAVLADRAAQSERIEKLQQFKDFVHRRLDEMGIPTHPNGEHSKAGCRIGDRLDIVADRAEREATKDDLLSALDELVSWSQDLYWSRVRKVKREILQMTFPEKKPLTEEQISEGYPIDETYDYKRAFDDGARWAEKMHGIGQTQSEPLAVKYTPTCPRCGELTDELFSSPRGYLCGSCAEKKHGIGSE